MMIATLPPVVGLHTATIAPFIYGAMGTSMQLSVGPVALASIYLPTSLDALGLNTTDDSPEGQLARAKAASLLTFWVGIIFISMGFLRMGCLFRYLSHSLMVGFTSAAGSYVAINELKHILELHPPNYHYHFSTFIWMIQHIEESNIRTVILGFSCLTILLTFKVSRR